MTLHRHPYFIREMGRVEIVDIIFSQSPSKITSFARRRVRENSNSGTWQKHLSVVILMKRNKVQVGPTWCTCGEPRSFLKANRLTKHLYIHAVQKSNCIYLLETVLCWQF
jgi:hypothetical protein